MARKRDRPEGEAPHLKDEDRALWQHVTRDAQPLAKRAPPPPSPARPDAPPAKTETEAKTQAKAQTRPAPVPLRPVAQSRRAEPALEHGRATGVDKRRTERLRRGQLPVEARLDLHGYTQDQAHEALDDFLGEAQGRGLRCVLVITGKGTTTGAAMGAGGVLRAQVPRWLNEPGNRARVLAFDYAQPKHGGLGAIYVLLRRSKG